MSAQQMATVQSYQVVKAVNPDVFRAYDIRGVVGAGFDRDAFYTLGRAIASHMQQAQQQHVVVGHDARLSSPELSRALIAGLRASGCHVINIGEVPTPVLYFASYHLQIPSAVMLTASHNPAEYNGLKIVMQQRALADGDIQALRQRILRQAFIHGQGTYQQTDVVDAYIDYICQHVQLAKPLKIAIDCGNGVAGKIAPRLYEKLGCKVIPLYCEIDGSFPNHHPDPTIAENVAELISTVQQQHADVGLAFDGDADRLGVISDLGEIIWPDRQLMLFAIDVLEHHPGAQIVFDVKCSRHLATVIHEHQGIPVLWKTGHSFQKRKLQELNAKLAGEMSGHVFFNDRWFGFDDGLYAGARLLEILARYDIACSEQFAALPNSVNTPEIKVPIAEHEKFAFVEQMQQHAQFPAADIIRIDGLRVEFECGWGLIRASNTSPYLILRFEADNAQQLRWIETQFKQQMLAIAPNMVIDF